MLPPKRSISRHHRRCCSRRPCGAWCYRKSMTHRRWIERLAKMFTLHGSDTEEMHFLPRGQLDFESAVTAQTEKFKDSFYSSSSRSLNAKTYQRNWILSLDTLRGQFNAFAATWIVHKENSAYFHGEILSPRWRQRLTNRSDVKYIYADQTQMTPLTADNLFMGAH